MLFPVSYLSGVGYTGSAGPLHAFSRELIHNSIGLQPFCNALDALSTTSAFLDIVNSQGPHTVQDGNPLDPEFVQYYHYLLPEIHKYIANEISGVDQKQTIAPPMPGNHPVARSDPGVPVEGNPSELMYTHSGRPMFCTIFANM